jgi:phage terminase large subunit GpA-like protein
MTKIKGQWREAVDVVARTMSHAFAALVEHVVEIAEARRLTPPVDGLTWLETHLRIPAGEGTIPFRFDDVPALREPFAMATSPGFTRGCLVKPVQAAATTVFCIGLPAYKLAARGENVVCTWATVDDAQKFSKTKLDPVVEASPGIGALFAPADRGNDTRSTILIKKAVRGILFMLGTHALRADGRERRSVVVRPQCRRRRISDCEGVGPVYVIRGPGAVDAVHPAAQRGLPDHGAVRAE